MRYKKGRSGNPAGRPPGIADKRTELRALLAPHADALVKKVVALALEGDTTALRLCLDRLIPPAKPRDLPVKLSGLGETLADQGRRILGAAADGDITPDEAGALMQAIAAQGRLVEIYELERRIAALEDQRPSTA
jgi:hypothetical protein